MKTIKLVTTAMFFTCCFGSVFQAAQAQVTDSPSKPQSPAIEQQQLTKSQEKKSARFKPDRVLPFKEILLKKGEAKQGELSLHQFNPKGHQATDRAPAIVFFFGGGWNGGKTKTIL